MRPKLIRNGGQFRSKIVRFECSCGYAEAGEGTMERLENDARDKEVREANKKEKIEPFIDPEEI